MTNTAQREARFSVFVETNRSRAIGLAWRLLGPDQHAAEDIVQQAFLKAWDKLEGFRGEAELSTWFYTIVIRQVRSHQRRMAIRRKFAFMDRFDAARPAFAPVGDTGLRQRISEALHCLSAGQREAFVLVHLEGYTITEAARVLNRSPGTIKSHLHRALKGLRERLGDLKEGAE